MKKGKIRNWFNSIFIYQKRKSTSKCEKFRKIFPFFHCLQQLRCRKYESFTHLKFPQKLFYSCVFFLRGFKKNIRLIGNEGLIRLNTYWMDLFGSCKHFVPFIRVLRPRSHCSMDDTRFLHFANRAVCYLLVKVFGLCAIPAIIDCHANRCID